jgi:hypothetical protein
MMTRVFGPPYTSSLARRPLGLILRMTYLNMLLVRRRRTPSTTANNAFEDGRSQASFAPLLAPFNADVRQHAR